MKLRPLYFIIVGLLIAIAFVLISLNLGSTAEKTAFAMGTPVRVKVKGPKAQQLVAQAIAEIKRLDKLFSRFNPKSEIAQLNAGKKLDLSPDTKAILKQSGQISKLTQGAFDINFQKGKGLDLGAIAKGYAVEKARQALMKSGAESGIIDMRSSIAVFGSRPVRIGVRDPQDSNKLIGVVELNSGKSLATSGNYERGTHIIDPRTGQPARGCQGVTIISNNASQADALATAVFVLGPVKGLQLIKSLDGVEACLVDDDGKVLITSGFKLQ